MLDPGGETTMGDLLAGLEWHAAAPALASLPPATLERFCAEASEAAEGKGGDGKCSDDEHHEQAGDHARAA